MVVTENQLGPEVPAEVMAAAEEAIEETLRRFQRAAMEVSLTIVAEDQMQALNQQYRDHDEPTDVLSFPLLEPGEQPLRADEPLGDIVICYFRAVQQAEDYGHGVMREMAFLAVHGTLHLLGYDHQSADEERAMFGLTEEILTALGRTR